MNRNVASTIRTFAGMNIVVNDLLIRTVPVRKHPFPAAHWPWRKDAFKREVRRHHRVQKKWDKRFGVHDEAYSIINGNMVFMHSLVYEELVRQRERGGTLFIDSDGAVKHLDGGILGKRATGVILDDIE